MADTPRIAVIENGEDGALIAGGLLAAGANVIGFEIARGSRSATPMAKTIEEAVAGANVILSISSATHANRVAEHVAELVKSGVAPSDVLYADLNPGTPATKKQLASLFPEGQFVDVALMRPVPGLAEKVPMYVAGTGAAAFMERMQPFGLNMTFVSDVPGEAAARNLLRGMLQKGIAGVVIDTLWAAESLGLEEWTYREILTEFNEMSEDTAREFIESTAVHFKRRQIEMADIVDMIAEADYESTMMAPVQFNYGRIMHGKQIPFSQKKPAPSGWLNQR